MSKHKGHRSSVKKGHYAERFFITERNKKRRAEKRKKLEANPKASTVLRREGRAILAEARRLNPKKNPGPKYTPKGGPLPEVVKRGRINFNGVPVDSKLLTALRLE